MLVLGIDPGIQGGIAALQDGKAVLAELLPTRTGHRGKTEIHSKAFEQLIFDLLCRLGVSIPGPEFWQNGIDLACVEDVHAIKGDAIVSLFSFAMNTGRLLGILEARGVSVQRVPPPTWKAKILRDTKRDKAAAIGYCNSKYPYQSLIPAGCRTPKDGLADAICIAEYGWRYLVKGEDHENP